MGTCIIVRTIAWAAEGSSTPFYSNPFSDRHTCMLDSVPRKIRQVLAVDPEGPNPPARVRANPARFSRMRGAACRMGSEPDGPPGRGPRTHHASRGRTQRCRGPAGTALQPPMPSMDPAFLMWSSLSLPPYLLLILA